MTEPAQEPVEVTDPGDAPALPAVPTAPAVDNSGHFLPPKVYDIVHLLAMIILPAAGAAYFSLAAIWGLPYADRIVGTITIIDTFLGVVVKISKAQYNGSDAQYDGDMNVTTTPDGAKTYSLSLNTDPDALSDQSKVVFKVNPL